MHSETYAAAVGRSFFEPLLQPASITLGWSSFAAIWLTQTPPEALGYVSAALVPAEVRLRLQAQGEADWRRFLEPALVSCALAGALSCWCPARPKGNLQASGR